MKKEKKVKKIKEIPAADRPMEKLTRFGAQSLSHLELMAVLVGWGNIHREVMETARDLAKVTEKEFDHLSVDKLQAVKGMGKTRACQILAAIEFARRFLIKEEIKISSAEDVILLVEELRNKKQEFFLTLTVDAANNLIQKRTVFIGTLNKSLVHPREVFAGAVSDRAAGIVLAHNHPSGLCEPSKDDFIVTNRLVEAGKVMGIPILDHIIVCKKGYFSFQKKGLIRNE